LEVMVVTMVIVTSLFILMSWLVNRSFLALGISLGIMIPLGSYIGTWRWYKIVWNDMMKDWNTSVANAVTVVERMLLDADLAYHRQGPWKGPIFSRGFQEVFQLDTGMRVTIEGVAVSTVYVGPVSRKDEVQRLMGLLDAVAP